MKVSMKFGSLTTATTPGGSGNGNSIVPEGGGGSEIKIESVADFPEDTTSETIYLVQKQVWVSPTDAQITNQKFESVEHLPPDADDNVLFLIRKR